MTPKERYEWLWDEAKKPLPNYQEVIRREWIRALKEVEESKEVIT